MLVLFTHFFSDHLAECFKRCPDVTNFHQNCSHLVFLIFLYIFHVVNCVCSVQLENLLLENILLYIWDNVYDKYCFDKKT